MVKDIPFSKIKWVFSIIALIFSFSMFANEDCNTECIEEYKDTHFCLSAEEVKLYDMINTYRAKRNLPEIELSTSLSFVAKTHAKDFEKHGDPRHETCNLHSWSENGDWDAMCYSSDHANAELMWSKPQELTNYPSAGYEIAAKTTGKMSPELALHLWKHSSGHNNVMANLKNWKDVEWKAIGIGIHKGFACIWFGEEFDVEGEPMACY